MSANNLMYQMYKQMVQGYKLGKDGEGLFEHAVRCWMDTNPENPFPEESEAFEHFFRMKNYYNVWRLGGADKKISMRRMFNAAKDLCATKTKNPYKFDKKAAEEEKAAIKDATMKAEQEAMRALEEAKRVKAEREEEVRQIMEELNQDNLENQSRVDAIQSAIDEAKANYKPVVIVPEKEEVNQEQSKHYVFGVPEKKEKKGWLSRLLKH